MPLEADLLHRTTMMSRLCQNEGKAERVTQLAFSLDDCLSLCIFFYWVQLFYCWQMSKFSNKCCSLQVISTECSNVGRNNRTMCCQNKYLFFSAALLRVQLQRRCCLYQLKLTANWRSCTADLLFFKVCDVAWTGRNQYFHHQTEPFQQLFG